jgi:uncharacterized membrane protein
MTQNLGFGRSLIVAGSATAALWATAAAATTYTTFDPSGSTGTYASSINAKGAITGFYYDSNHVSHGFVRAKDGTITSFDPPGSTNTQAYGINDKGAIAGEYQDSNNVAHGFLRTP